MRIVTWSKKPDVNSAVPSKGSTQITKSDCWGRRFLWRFRMV
jgi:hypothetical protein